MALSVIDTYLAATPTDFPVVAAIQLLQHVSLEQTPSLDVVLELAQRSDSGRLLRLTFIRVLKLCLRQPPWSLFEITFLDIRDVSSDQCEGVRFNVKDSEGEALSLLCADIRIELVGDLYGE